MYYNSRDAHLGGGGGFNLKESNRDPSLPTQKIQLISLFERILVSLRMVHVFKIILTIFSGLTLFGIYNCLIINRCMISRKYCCV